MTETSRREIREEIDREINERVDYIIGYTKELYFYYYVEDLPMAESIKRCIDDQDNRIRELKSALEVIDGF